MDEKDTVEKLKKIDEPAIICQHLSQNQNLNLNFPEDIDEDDEFWCDECAKILQEEGGWTDRALEFAGLRPCCKYCLADMKSRYMKRQSKY